MHCGRFQPRSTRFRTSPNNNMFHYITQSLPSVPHYGMGMGQRGFFDITVESESLSDMEVNPTEWEQGIPERHRNTQHWENVPHVSLD